jgi:hypothetical protein
VATDPRIGQRALSQWELGQKSYLLVNCDLLNVRGQTNLTIDESSTSRFTRFSHLAPALLVDPTWPRVWAKILAPKTNSEMSQKWIFVFILIDAAFSQVFPLYSKGMQLMF